MELRSHIAKRRNRLWKLFGTFHLSFISENGGRVFQTAS